jgi:hypothetical protein
VIVGIEQGVCMWSMRMLVRNVSVTREPKDVSLRLTRNMLESKILSRPILNWLFYE